MSFFSKIRGTFETLFQIGKGGPQLKDNGGALDIRNNVDGAFVNARGADPVINDDLITLRYFNAHNAGATALTVVKMPLAQATKISSVAIPDNSVIWRAILDVTVAYNGASPTFKIQRTGDATVVVEDTGDSDLTAIGTYEVPQAKSWGATGLGTVTATFAGSGVTLGAAVLYVAYASPTDIS